MLELRGKSWLDMHLKLLRLEMDKEGRHKADMKPRDSAALLHGNMGSEGGLL